MMSNDQMSLNVCHRGYVKCHLSMKKLRMKNHAKASSIRVSEFIFFIKSPCFKTFDVDCFNRNYNNFFILTI